MLLMMHFSWELCRWLDNLHHKGVQMTSNSSWLQRFISWKLLSCSCQGSRGFCLRLLFWVCPNDEDDNDVAHDEMWYNENIKNKSHYTITEGHILHLPKRILSSYCNCISYNYHFCTSLGHLCCFLYLDTIGHLPPEPVLGCPQHCEPPKRRCAVLKGPKSWSMGIPWFQGQVYLQVD